MPTLPLPPPPRPVGPANAEVESSRLWDAASSTGDVGGAPSSDTLCVKASLSSPSSPSEPRLSGVGVWDDGFRLGEPVTRMGGGGGSRGGVSLRRERREEAVDEDEEAIDCRLCGRGCRCVRRRVKSIVPSRRCRS